MEPTADPVPLISMLLVEDEQETLELLISAFEIRFPGIVLHGAINGRMGFELFKAHAPDILITDINMPEMGGVQMANRIRAIKPDTKIIVLTADTGKATMEHAVGDGFEIDHYITKPVDFMVLFAAIEQCLGEIRQKG